MMKLIKKRTPLHEAMLYSHTQDKTVVCSLCHHRCVVQPGRSGICGVRENVDGRFVSLVYGKIAAEHIDPIEKKPLFHFLPGSRTYSIATVGCNFRCLHCQNYELSQYPQKNKGRFAGQEKTPARIVEEAAASGCESISYTYVEPTIFYEFAKACAELSVKKSIRNVFVSNGFMTPETVRDLAPFVHGINIDIKFFSDAQYKKICNGRLQPVLDTIALFKELGVWVEITTLIIPGLNDATKDLQGIARFISSVDSDIPWHVTAFRPTYQMLDRPATSLDMLQKAYQIGKECGLSYVYQGNIPGEGQNTNCPSCGQLLLQRNGYFLKNKGVQDGQCIHCEKEIAGIWS